MRGSSRLGLLAATTIAAAGISVPLEAFAKTIGSGNRRGPGNYSRSQVSRSCKRYPQMIVDKDDQNQWNGAVQTRQVLRATEKPWKKFRPFAWRNK